MPTIFDQAKSLPLEQRIDLVEEIWETIDEELESLDLTDAQRVELERRIAAYALSPRGPQSG